VSDRWRAFRHRNYRLFFAGQAVSVVGTWMQQVAQGWLVLQLTGDPFWLGLVAVAQYGPVLVLGLVGGVLADQLPKRRTLVVTRAVSMAPALILFGLTAAGVVEVWHVLLLALVLGTANAFDMPARQAFAVEMVGHDDVANAVGFNSALFNASRIIGPAVAGVLIGVFDLSVAFLINGLAYVAVIVAYLAMREDELRPAARTTRATSWSAVVANLAEGTRYVRDTPVVLMAVVVAGLVSALGMNYQVLVPPLADHVLHAGASGFGFLMAAAGIGSTMAALGVAFSRRVRPRLMAVGAVVLGLSLVLIAWSSSFVVSLILLAVGGAGAIAMTVTGNTTIQSVVPDHLRGRVMSVFGTVFIGSTPAGGLLMGTIASAGGVPLAFAVGGVLTVLVGALTWMWVGRIERSEPVRVPAEATLEAAMAAGAMPAVEAPLTPTRR
jgi:MFS family permease